jgi:hypothetical protein
MSKARQLTDYQKEQLKPLVLDSRVLLGLLVPPIHLVLLPPHPQVRQDRKMTVDLVKVLQTVEHRDEPMQ